MTVATVVEVYIKPGYAKEFEAISLYNHENSVKEPGNIRFDILKSNDDPTRYTLFEVYESEDAAKAHKQTEHYKKWRQTVEPMMACPRKGIAHTPLNKM
ncbi:MAG: antibiotic biosynthesis monooxygenase [Clostridia bacterium]|nr:antibiotic biosynthesis monooxygenase [Clostridia bacterium]